MWPAPAQSSSTGPAGAVLISSAAQRDWAAVHARGASTRASYSIRSPSKSTNCASFVLMIGRYPHPYPAHSPLRAKGHESGRAEATPE